MERVGTLQTVTEDARVSKGQDAVVPGSSGLFAQSLGIDAVGDAIDFLGSRKVSPDSCGMRRQENPGPFLLCIRRWCPKNAHPDLCATEEHGDQDGGEEQTPSP